MYAYVYSCTWPIVLFLFYSYFHLYYPSFVSIQHLFILPFRLLLAGTQSLLARPARSAKARPIRFPKHPAGRQLTGDSKAARTPARRPVDPWTWPWGRSGCRPTAIERQAGGPTVSLQRGWLERTAAAAATAAAATTATARRPT